MICLTKPFNFYETGVWDYSHNDPTEQEIEAVYRWLKASYEIHESDNAYCEQFRRVDRRKLPKISARIFKWLQLHNYIFYEEDEYVKPGWRWTYRSSILTITDFPLALVWRVVSEMVPEEGSIGKSIFRHPSWGVLNMEHQNNQEEDNWKSELLWSLHSLGLITYRRVAEIVEIRRCDFPPEVLYACTTDAAISCGE